MFLGILLSAMITDTVNYNRDERARREAIDADKRQLENQKELMRYQTELESDTNTIATQKGHAASAGVNPALMFNSLPGLANVSAGSAQGSVPELSDWSKVAEKIHPSDMSSLVMQNKQQNLLSRQISSQEEINHANAMLSFAKTAEELRNSKHKKRMEQIIYDQGMADLEKTRFEAQGINIQNIRAGLLLPGELENQGLINQNIAAQINKINDDLKTNAVARAKMRTEMQSIQRDMEYTEKRGKLTDAELAETQERMRGSVIERVMKEFGLNRRSIPAWARKDKIENYYLRQPQLLGAVAALTQQGFSIEEATAAAIYYQSGDSKDASPSVINAVSRGISALILKK